jgi:predicted phosphodiesterase
LVSELFDHGRHKMAFSDQLNDLLAQPVTAQAKPSRQRDWGFTQEHAPHDHDTRNITATSGTKLETEDDWTQFVIDNGGALAPGYRVRLVEMRHNTNAWQRSAQGEDATTTGSWFYKFAVEPVIVAAHVEDLVKLIRRRKAPASPAKGPGVFHQLMGDTQLGKMDGDGTKGIVDAFIKSVDDGAREFKRLRSNRSLGLVSLAMLGDCGEGNQSQNGRNMWRTELTITEQYRLLRRLLLYSIDAYAPLAERVELDVVNGNHDEVQRFQATRADDGHATESAIALSDQLAMNPAGYGHVKVFVPDKDESYITREVGSSTVTMAHGHQWARGKAMTWWSGQSFNWQAPGAAQFLFHGHEHEMSMQSKRDRVVICVPPFESESTWWRHKTGDVSKRGSMVLTTSGGEFSDLSLV